MFFVFVIYKQTLGGCVLPVIDLMETRGEGQLIGIDWLIINGMVHYPMQASMHAWVVIKKDRVDGYVSEDPRFGGV